MLRSVRRCLFLLFLCSSIPARSSCLRVDGHSCVTSYWYTVTCLLNITDQPVGDSAYNLSFIHKISNALTSCPLTVMNHSYGCVCELRKGKKAFRNIDVYTIKLCHESGCLLLAETFKPSKNIQLRPPHRAMVQHTPEISNVTWVSGYESHGYLAEFLKYELLLQTSHGKDRRTLSPNDQQQFVSVSRSELTADATYCIKVRSKPSESSTDYKAIWSDWSPSTCWKNEAGEEDNKHLIILIKSLPPLFVSVGVLLFISCSPKARMKIKSLSHTPSPAPFFKPLFQEHDGNLQEWLSLQGKCLPVYKIDEFLTTSAVVVEPKPVTKDPEEDQDFHNPSVTPFEFPQCQTTYVGLPSLLVASPPLTMECQMDMSYTQWPPCSVWGADLVEAEVLFPSSPKDFPIFIRADSSLCSDDLTQSPEGSLPDSPVVDTPVPCNYTDYCTLNKTAQGFAPVILS